MDKIGLTLDISNAAINIDAGRKGFATKGKAEEGRMSYETGIAQAMSAFQAAQTSVDPQAMILAEYTFITQELQFSKKDKHSLNSLTKAVHSFDDAFLAIKSVDEKCYKIADNIFPHNGKHRVNGYPKDSFHIAFASHKTRLKNILRSPGIDSIEKDLLEQRLANLSTAQNGYVERQKMVLGDM